jgi:hypothetical protein
MLAGGYDRGMAVPFVFLIGGVLVLALLAVAVVVVLLLGDGKR